MQDRDPPLRRDVNRRDLLALGLGAFVVAALPLRQTSRPAVIRRRVPVMGTLADIVAIHPDAACARAGAAAAVLALRRVERTMSRFDRRSDVGRANAADPREAVDITRETAFVVERALRFAEATDGGFDPCLGAAAALWDVNHRRTPPAEDVVRRLADRRLYRALDLDACGHAPRVRRGHPDAAIDLGGIAKGYGVDQAVAALRENGVERGFVNVGGDLYALGRSEDGAPWRVGVRAPHAPDTVQQVLEVTDLAVATSGDYEQHFTWRGTRYHHLFDPSTGAPRRTARHSVTVTADTCLTADAAATAVFGMDVARAARLLEAAAPAAALVSPAQSSSTSKSGVTTHPTNA